MYLFGYLWRKIKIISNSHSNFCLLTSQNLSLKAQFAWWWKFTYIVELNCKFSNKNFYSQWNYQNEKWLMLLEQERRISQQFIALSIWYICELCSKNFYQFCKFFFSARRNLIKCWIRWNDKRECYGYDFYCWI